MPSTRNYIPVSTSTEGEDAEHLNQNDVTTGENGRVNTIYYLVIFVQAVVIVALTLTALRHPYAMSIDSARQVLVYSPAKDIATGQLVTFDLSPEKPSRYRDNPSDEVDSIWRDLYRAGISYLKPEEKENLQLAGEDAEKIAERPDKLIQLAVFHDLHCVNKLRQRLHQDYYTASSLLLGTWHMDHCIDALRQTIMCASDITPIAWRWNYARGMIMRDASVVHQCRDFDKVKEWAMARVPEVR
ncbi:hypothetical protein VKT23_002683 [Stygiomarasmius scandens]|uniref:Uncharacterized protein n=1 Tax=Marasmiellus scandens TaxID=2682957 RepID=A0ABR1K687_9AGAR